MTFVVTENCIRCKHTDCVEVCPADAFREGPNFLVISPDDCIDCALCVPACPVKAIYQEEEVPQDQKQETETLVRRLMEGAGKGIGVPLLVEAGWGMNWADAH